jgi:aspartokinase/homoserine dehydrogenase 1
MNVLKFGGSSVASSECIEQVKHIVECTPSAKWIVVSAMCGITDMLLTAYKQATAGDTAWTTAVNTILHKHIHAAKMLITSPEQQQKVSFNMMRLSEELSTCLKETAQQRIFSDKIQDYILSFGERMNGYLISNVIESSEWIDARTLIRTDSRYGNAKVDITKTYSQCHAALHSISGRAIIPGFIASNENGDTTTLGRGGSDYTAAIIAAAMNANSVEIWTDTDGFMTADPRKIPTARTIERMTYDEVFELARFGAKVVYPPTIYPLLVAKIPMYIKNTFNTACMGTHVSGNASNSATTICSVSSMENVDGNMELSMLAAVGERLRHDRDILPQMQNLLSQNNIQIFDILQQSISILVMVKKSDLDIATKLIHETFIINSKC